MSAALIDSAGKVRVLDGKAGPDETVTEEHAKDPARVARILIRILATIAALKRAFSPKRIDYEDVAVLGSGALVQLQHGFGSRTRWWVIGWQSGGTAAPIFIESTALTTASTLVLQSYVAGTVTLRVESSG